MCHHYFCFYRECSFNRFKIVRPLRQISSMDLPSLSDMHEFVKLICDFMHNRFIQSVFIFNLYFHQRWSDIHFGSAKCLLVFHSDSNFSFLILNYFLTFCDVCNMFYFWPLSNYSEPSVSTRKKIRKIFDC